MVMVQLCSMRDAAATVPSYMSCLGLVERSFLRASCRQEKCALLSSCILQASHLRVPASHLRVRVHAVGAAGFRVSHASLITHILSHDAQMS